MSSHDLSKLRSLSLLYFEMSCLPLIGSKVVARELLDITEAGEDGRDGGCAMGWTKSLAKAYNRGSFRRAGANRARRRGLQILQQQVMGAARLRSRTVQLNLWDDCFDRIPVVEGSLPKRIV